MSGTTASSTSDHRETYQARGSAGTPGQRPVDGGPPDAAEESAPSDADDALRPGTCLVAAG
ncbi:hypothetical protein IHE61_22480 [Streptomyces sp. GKU 257-1]|nr:hypothetical protein [Streptomyces sp. GKU 257-1]